jgi:hypothetical protein
MFRVLRNGQKRYAEEEVEVEDGQLAYQSAKEILRSLELAFADKIVAGGFQYPEEVNTEVQLGMFGVNKVRMTARVQPIRYKVPPLYEPGECHP